MSDTSTHHAVRILIRTLTVLVLVMILAYAYTKLSPAAAAPHAYAVFGYSRRHQQPRRDSSNASDSPHVRRQVTPVTTLAECMQSDSHGWCVDRQGGGKCVPGFLDGAFDPTVHCANWRFRGMCQNGPRCRRIDAVPPPSLARSWYHHPAPYDYRSIPLTPEADVARHVVG
jgi:hypothetical protein